MLTCIYGGGQVHYVGSTTYIYIFVKKKLKYIYIYIYIYQGLMKKFKDLPWFQICCTRFTLVWASSVLELKQKSEWDFFLFYKKFGLVWSYGISTIIGDLMPNPFLYI